MNRSPDVELDATRQRPGRPEEQTKGRRWHLLTVGEIVVLSAASSVWESLAVVVGFSANGVRLLCNQSHQQMTEATILVVSGSNAPRAISHLIRLHRNPFPAERDEYRNTTARQPVLRGRTVDGGFPAARRRGFRLAWTIYRRSERHVVGLGVPCGPPQLDRHFLRL